MRNKYSVSLPTTEKVPYFSGNLRDNAKRAVLIASKEQIPNEIISKALLAKMMDPLSSNIFVFKEKNGGLLIGRCTGENTTICSSKTISGS